MKTSSRTLARFLGGSICVVLAGVLAATINPSAGLAAQAGDPAVDLLIKVESQKSLKAMKSLKSLAQKAGGNIQNVTGVLHDGTSWVSLKSSAKALAPSVALIKAIPGVRMVQPNYKIRLLSDYQIKDQNQRTALANSLRTVGFKTQDGRSIDQVLKGVPSLAKADNPPIPSTVASGSHGADPLAGNQWGMIDNHVTDAWNRKMGEGAVVAVIDTGVDYTHEDLVENLWRNPGETGLDANGADKSTNGIDDDGNGYIDDVIGWDFAYDDNKPYDLASDPLDLLFGGGNPGHGTHCAGNVAARGDNGIGIAGMAPKAKIMALRFITEKGEGTTEAAIKAVEYSIKMGARISSNSWGSSGEDPEDAAGNQALRDVIEEARLAGQLFVAAAGNGDAQGRGYDNDTSSVPAYPASYPHENIVSVAALDKTDNLGSFSNWGSKTVDLGAPGVAVYSTMVGNQYSDKVIDLPQFGITATWDGTSMAAPHVAGAAALYLADHPEATVEEMKSAILKATKPISSLSTKATTNGKLSADKLGTM